jgi:hypothetical protein
MYANAKEVKAVSKDGYYLYCVELAFARVPGVIATSVGYTEGKLEHPRYELVCSGSTGHTEVVQLTYGRVQRAGAGALYTHPPLSQGSSRQRPRNSQYRKGVYYHTPRTPKPSLRKSKCKLGPGLASVHNRSRLRFTTQLRNITNSTCGRRVAAEGTPSLQPRDARTLSATVPRGGSLPPSRTPTKLNKQFVRFIPS